MSNVADLAARKDIELGALTVSPSRRIVAGPEGETSLEPLVMQVLLLLIDSGGSVVTRNQIFDECWGGVMVGDDSINRAIGILRKALSTVAPGTAEIETIPRTGYRLVRIDPKPAEARLTAGEGKRPLPLSRRAMIGGGAAIATLAIAGAGLQLVRHPADPTVERLMAAGDQALRNGAAFDHFEPPLTRSAVLADYEEVVRIDPGNAKAWGLLGYFRSTSAEHSGPAESGEFVRQAREAIDRALAIDPREPNAHAAMFVLEGPMLDWATRDRRLRSILETDPDNVPALTELMTLLQATGFTRES